MTVSPTRGLPDVLDAGDEVADLADAETVGGLRVGGDHADLEQLVGGAGRVHEDALAGREHAVDDADVGDDAAVGVVDGVEDQGARRGVSVADRVRDLAYDPVEQLGDTDAGLGAHPEHVVGVAADDVRQLGRVLLRLGGGEIDLVEHGDDDEVVLQREVEVGQRLRLDALGCVDEQDRAFASGKAARHLVGEVDVPWRVDQVEHVVQVVVGLERQPHRLGLDRDAALALDVHPVEVLRPHLTAVDDTRDLEHPVGQSGLAVVDVGDDAEVADARRVGTARVGRSGLGQRGRSVSIGCGLGGGLILP